MYVGPRVSCGYAAQRGEPVEVRREERAAVPQPKPFLTVSCRLKSNSLPPPKFGNRGGGPTGTISRRVSGKHQP